MAFSTGNTVDILESRYQRYHLRRVTSPIPLQSDIIVTIVSAANPKMHEKITRLTGMFTAPSGKHQQQQQQQLPRQQQQKNPSTSKRNAIVSSVNRGTMSSSSTSSSSTSSGNTKQQQQQPAQSQSITNKDKSSSGAVSGKSATEESVPVVRMRNKPPLSQIQQEVPSSELQGQCGKRSPRELVPSIS